MIAVEHGSMSIGTSKPLAFASASMQPNSFRKNRCTFSSAFREVSENAVAADPLRNRQPPRSQSIRHALRGAIVRLRAGVVTVGADPDGRLEKLRVETSDRPVRLVQIVIVERLFLRRLPAIAFGEWLRAARELRTRERPERPGGRSHRADRKHHYGMKRGQVRLTELVRRFET
jgi:hypothetical protein